MDAHEPRVALETTVLSHGLPWPDNRRLADTVEAAVESAGAQPCTVGYLNGTCVTGLSGEQLDHFCRPATGTGDIRKVSIRDIPIIRALGLDGATTVSATMHAAHSAGIAVVATGGIGGVHRDVSDPDRPGWDESADLTALASIPVAVVCSGPKAILHLAATRERLETLGVTVVGYRTDSMPAFYCGVTDLPVDARADSPEQIAAIVRARNDARLTHAVLIVQPIDEEDSIPLSLIDDIVRRAGREAHASGVTAAGMTPFLLDRVRSEIGEKALTSNMRLLERNARLAGRIAVCLAA